MFSLARLALAAPLMAAFAHASLVHDFRFQSSLSDSLSAATMTGLGGVAGATTYLFTAQQGLSLASPALSDPGTYSIALRFSFLEVSGYRRILDFKNLTSDTGLYVLSSNLNFFNFASGSGAPIAAVFPVDVVITRDAVTSTVNGYVNGTLAFSFNDAGGAGVFSNDIAYFFRDDNSVGGEASGGYVDRIMIWNNALTGSEVAALDLGNDPGSGGGSPVPEPSTLTALLASGGALAAMARRRTGGRSQQ